jgi:hypothetical protein
MRTAPAPPYALPPEDAVKDEPWSDADGRELPERLEHWDSFTEIELFRALDVDLDAVRTSCRLGADATFAIVGSWYSHRTRLSGPAAVVELGQLRGVVRAPLSVHIPGDSAGGRLDLRTALVLRHPGTLVSPISPKREGAVLWFDSTSMALEGGSARFPVTALDFEAVSALPDNASWKLEWRPEALDAPVLGDLRLLVNSADESLLSALRSGAADPRSSAVRSFVMFDVARALVDGALSNDQFVEDPEAFDIGSIGRMLFELTSMCWPGIPLKILASRRREDPARLEAELQAHLRLLQ